jgi:hypothetical protein
VDAAEYSLDDAIREGIVTADFSDAHRPGAIACAASHVRLWQQIGARGHAFALVLEDDCWFHPCLRDPRCFSTYWSAVPSTADFVFLGCLGPYADATPGEETLLDLATPVNEHVARVHRSPNGTHAYALTAACAVRLLERMLPLRNPIDWLPAEAIEMYALRRIADPRRFGVDPDDVDPGFYANSSIWGGRFLIHVHGLVSQGPLPSTIR